jgi:hypothetical protein
LLAAQHHHYGTAKRSATSGSLDGISVTGALHRDEYQHQEGRSRQQHLAYRPASRVS